MLPPFRNWKYKKIQSVSKIQTNTKYKQYKQRKFRIIYLSIWPPRCQIGRENVVNINSDFSINLNRTWCNIKLINDIFAGSAMSEVDGRDREMWYGDLSKLLYTNIRRNLFNL